MTDENKKLDLDDLDLSSIGSTVQVEASPEGEEDSVQDESQGDIEGYRIFNKPIQEASFEEVKTWLCSHWPKINPDKLRESAFDSTEKRKNVVDKVIYNHAAINYSFQGSNRPKEYLN